jgi:hypothetical protein
MKEGRVGVHHYQESKGPAMMPALRVSKRLDLNTPLLTRGLLRRSYCGGATAPNSLRS